MRKSSRMAPKEKQTIEIEKTHRDPLPSFNQAVTVDCSDFLGTALIPVLASSPALKSGTFRLPSAGSLLKPSRWVRAVSVAGATRWLPQLSLMRLSPWPPFQYFFLMQLANKYANRRKLRLPLPPLLIRRLPARTRHHPPPTLPPSLPRQPSPEQIFSKPSASSLFSVSLLLFSNCKIPLTAPLASSFFSWE